MADDDAKGPVLNQVNVTARDWEASLAFYRLLGCVDETFERLTAAGHTGRQAPHDAFWGARYALVADPDGRPVGLQSPVDPALRSRPPGG